MPYTYLQNGNQPMTDSPIYASDLFGTEPITTDYMSDTLNTLTNDRDQLERVITETRGIVLRARDRVEQYQKRESYQREIVHETHNMRDRDRLALMQALSEIHSDSPKVSLESPQWQAWCRVIVTVGVATGYASDVHSLMRELDEVMPFDANELWRDVSAGMRDSEGSFPESVSSEIAISRAWSRYASDLPLHPSDPRLSDGWEAIWRSAKRADLCNVWDDMAQRLGVPEVVISRSGYVTVSGSFSVNVYVDGVTDTGDIDIDWSEVIDQMTRDDVYIDDIETSELELD